MGDEFPSKPQSQHLLQPVNLFSSSRVQSSNEKTPKSKCHRLHATPTLNRSSGREPLKSSRFNILAESPLCKTQYSTPRHFASDLKCVTDSSSCNENECSITNPFENHSTIDSLLFPSFSPSVFAPASNHTSDELINQSPGSFWNIDQIALMKPADIDLSKLHEQPNFVKFDPATEQKAQKAIDNFFASHINISSPWSSSDHPHYFAIISPAVPTSASGCNRIIRRQDVLDSHRLLASESPMLENAKNISHKNCTSNKARTVASQTTLTVPSNVDLEQLLGKYYTYNNKCVEETIESQASEVLSNSSLRRKLFFKDIEDNDPEVSLDETSKSGHLINRFSDDIDAFPITSDSQPNIDKHPTAKENITTPSFKPRCSIYKNLSAYQSPFSSSPVSKGRMFDLGTPYCPNTYDEKESAETFLSFSECSPINVLNRQKEGQQGNRSVHHRVIDSTHIPAQFDEAEANAVVTPLVYADPVQREMCVNVNLCDTENHILEIKQTENQCNPHIHASLCMSPQLSPIADTSHFHLNHTNTQSL